MKLYRIQTLIFICIFSACTYDQLPVVEEISGYPNEVASIILKKCATAGCHNTLSKSLAAGLSLESWNELFQGSNGGAVIIPFRPDFSSMMYFINSDSSQGLALIPRMPYNGEPLSQQEYLLLKNWIAEGAPDKNGFVKFSDNPFRKKLFISNQQADVISVIDVSSGLLMRFIDTGASDSTEFAHTIKCSPDGKYFYSLLFAGTVFQKFSTQTNSFINEVNIGNGIWNTFSISNDSKKAYVSDMSQAGKILVIDLETMSVQSVITSISFPHGSAINNNNDTLYTVSQFGNFIYKIPLADPANIISVSLDSLSPPDPNAALDPHEIIFNEDFSKYYVTCQRSDEIRVMQTSNDKLIGIIPVSRFPVEMVLSRSKPYLFVTCMAQENPGSSILGRVEVIDINTNSIIKSIVPGHQPHGIAISDSDNKIFIANRNVSHGGPAGHHAPPGARNGYLTAIDLNTLELIPGYQVELTIDPYSIAITP